jgi:hypothetical protein
MRFEAIPVQAVKSMSQRNLAIHWQALHARRGLPRFADFSPGDRAHDPRQILLWRVDEQGSARSYRPLYKGDYVYEAFGRDATSIDDIPEPLRDAFWAGLDACAESADIVYMSIATSDSSGHRIECERLLLPFGNGSAKVTHMLASLQLFSAAGTFRRDTIRQQFERGADVTFCGRIPPKLAAASARAQAERSNALS